MDFIEQNCRHTRQFWISDNPVAEYALGQDQYLRCRRLLAVHPRGVTNRFTDRLTHQFGNPLRRHPRSQTARREQQYLPVAPILVEQSWRNHRRLARTRRRDQNCISGNR